MSAALGVGGLCGGKARHEKSWALRVKTVSSVSLCTMWYHNKVPQRHPKESSTGSLGQRHRSDGTFENPWQPGDAILNYISGRDCATTGCASLWWEASDLRGPQIKSLQWPGFGFVCLVLEGSGVVEDELDLLTLLPPHPKCPASHTLPSTSQTVLRFE